MPANHERKQEADRLYKQYGQPLEAEHRGEYVAIAPDGRTALAPTPAEALIEGRRALGPGNFIFKIGDRVVVTWR